MAKAISLHVDVSYTDQEQYGRNIRTLVGAHASAVAMKELAESKGFITTFLTPREATKERIEECILDAARELEEDGIFFFTIHCHGESRPAPLEAEPDKTSEYLLLYDQDIMDKEFTQYLRSFQHGVRIFCIIDACNAGTIIQPAGEQELSRRMPGGENMDRDPADNSPVTVIAMSSSTDSTVAFDADANNGSHYTNFTKAFLEVWDEGNFHGTYIDLFRKIELELGTPQRMQKPSYKFLGDRVYCEADYRTGFEKQIPLTIAAPSTNGSLFKAQKQGHTANLTVKLVSNTEKPPITPIVLFKIMDGTAMPVNANAEGDEVNTFPCSNIAIHSILYTDKLGVCTFFGLAMGCYALLSHDMKNGQHLLEYIEIKESGNKTHNCFFTRGGVIGSVIAFVTDHGMAVSEPASVCITPFNTLNGGIPLCSNTDADGIARFDFLPQDNYQISAIYKGQLQSQTRLVPEVGTVNVSFSF